MFLRQKSFIAWITSGLITVTNASPLVVRDNTDMGLHWAPNCTCDANAIDQITAAMADTIKISFSAIAALQKPTSDPAAYLFPSSFASDATAVFKTVTEAVAPEPLETYSNLNLIYLYCEDLDSKCGPGIWGYIPENSNPAPGFGQAQIVICPAMLTLPRNAAACTGTPGQATLGWAFLRTFVQLRSVQSGYPILAAREIGDSSPGLGASHQLVTSNGAYDQNADNFAELATWSWDLGVGPAGSQCPANCALMGHGADCGTASS